MARRHGGKGRPKHGDRSEGRATAEPGPDWKGIEANPDFRELVAARKRFTVPAVVFFILYYFSLPVLVGYFPRVMETRVIGSINLAYLFALSQFFMAWILAYLYVRRADAFDRMAEWIAAKAKGRS